MRKQIFFIMIACLIAAGCSGGAKTIALEPGPVAYTSDTLSPRLSTRVRTDHQGFHELTRAEGRIERDGAVYVIFQPELPAYWLGMELYIAGGNFQARPYGTPFKPVRAQFVVTRQELILQDLPLTAGRIVSGCASVNFIQRDSGGQESPHFFTGCFSVPLYPEGKYASGGRERLLFIAGEEYALARHELGRPLHEADFTAGKADGFRAAMLSSKASNRTEIREATWDVSPEAQVSDGGRERLSVWYARQGDQWFPLAHRFWTSGDAAYPAYLDKRGE